MLQVHDFLLDLFGGHDEFGLKPGLAKRELGGEMVCLTEMWLDDNDKVRGDSSGSSGSSGSM